MYSAYKLNKQGDNMQPCHISFPILNQSTFLFLTVASLPKYRFLRRHVRWSGTPITCRIFHSLLWSRVKGVSIVNEEEVDACFLEFLCFFHVGNLISSSYASLKPSLYTWRFSVHIVMKPSLRNFEYNLGSMWKKHNYTVVWTCLALPILGIVKQTDIFWSCGLWWVFQICWHMESAPKQP